MKARKYFLTIALCGTLGIALQGQTNAPNNYKALTLTYEEQARELTERGNALVIAGASYQAAIDKILETAEGNSEGNRKRATRQRQGQVEWMKNIAPIYVSAVENKKEQSEKISLCVNHFSEEFALSNEQKKAIEKHLAAYADAYKGYAASYYGLLQGLNDGKIPGPKLPPPPPPVQQHHRH